MSVRDDLRRKFVPLMGDDSKEILNYAYHSNANRPSGETVFKQLLRSDLSAKRPIMLRVNELNPKIKLNFLYASGSWLYREKEDAIRKALPNHQIDYKIIQNAGHHLYSDNAEEFNDAINTLEDLSKWFRQIVLASHRIVRPTHSLSTLGLHIDLFVHNRINCFSRGFYSLIDSFTNCFIRIQNSFNSWSFYRFLDQVPLKLTKSTWGGSYGLVW